eukprot:13813565-Heterocapsa_arctica.AAC.1
MPNRVASAPGTDPPRAETGRLLVVIARPRPQWPGRHANARAGSTNGQDADDAGLGSIPARESRTDLSARGRYEPPMRAHQPGIARALGVLQPPPGLGALSDRPTCGTRSTPPHEGSAKGNLVP